MVTVNRKIDHGQHKTNSFGYNRISVSRIEKNTLANGFALLQKINFSPQIRKKSQKNPKQTMLSIRILKILIIFLLLNSRKLSSFLPAWMPEAVL